MKAETIEQYDGAYIDYGMPVQITILKSKFENTSHFVAAVWECAALSPVNGEYLATARKKQEGIDIEVDADSRIILFNLDKG